MLPWLVGYLKLMVYLFRTTNVKETETYSADKHFRDRVCPALAPPPWPCKGKPWRSKVWSWNRSHALIQTLQSSSLHVGMRNEKKVIPLYFSGHHSSKRHWPKQQWWALRFFSSISKGVPKHWSRRVVASLARPFSCPCAFHVLFYLKRGTRLASWK